MREKFARFMIGRYGSDQFGRFLSIVSLITLLAGMFIRNAAGTALSYFALALLIFTYYRMFSKNISKRYQENIRYLGLKGRVTGRLLRLKSRMEQRKTHRYFKCPQCGVSVRVPRGKGTIKISCPKCKLAFIKNT